MISFESFVPQNVSDAASFTNSVQIEGETGASDNFSVDSNRGFFFKSMETTVVTELECSFLKTTNFQRTNQFAINKDTWNRQTGYFANCDFENDYFKEIVAMGEDAIPMIIEELRKGPSAIVYALDKIYPGKVECEGYVPLKPLCDLWLDILTGKVKL